MKKKINTQRQKQALYESIMRQVAPEIRKALRESEEMNEGLLVSVIQVNHQKN